MLKIGKAPFLECSSKGDKRFSAFYAVVNGKSIEDQYQAAKVFSDGSTNLSWRQAKGKRAINMDTVRKLYSDLWNQYLNEHPELVHVLSNYGGFTDMFGKSGNACQAEEVFKYKQRLNRFERSSLDILI